MAQTQFRSDDTDQWNYKFGNGSDGAYAPNTGTDAPVDSACTGTSGTTSLSATNAGFTIGQLILIHQTRGTGAGAWELNAIADYSVGTITTVKALKNTYTSGAQVLVMPQYTSINIASGKTITAKAWNGTVGGIYAKFCNGKAEGLGTLNLSGKGCLGVAGVSGNSDGKQGEGYTADGGSTSINANTTGGGGGWCGAKHDGFGGGGGGGGGHAAAGSAGGQGGTAGSGGKAGTIGRDNASLTIAHFGGGGGSGGHQYDTGASGNGGAGSGFLLIIAKEIDFSELTVNNNGINGSAATGGDGGGGGGGAGGSILYKGQKITLGSTKTTATAGSGGAKAGSGGVGGAGAVGRIHADYSKSITGTTTPTIDTTQDASLGDAGGAFLYNFI